MTQTIDTTAGLRWLTTMRSEATDQDERARWQYAIDKIRIVAVLPLIGDGYDFDNMPYGIRVHVTHCCADHGCKYSTSNCPVYDLRIVQQESRCEQCYERQERMEQVLQGVEEAAAAAFPGPTLTILSGNRRAFIQGARWAASRSGIGAGEPGWLAEERYVREAAAGGTFQDKVDALQEFRESQFEWGTIYEVTSTQSVISPAPSRAVAERLVAQSPTDTGLVHRAPAGPWLDERDNIVMETE